MEYAKVQNPMDKEDSKELEVIFNKLHVDMLKYSEILSSIENKLHKLTNPKSMNDDCNKAEPKKESITIVEKLSDVEDLIRYQNTRLEKCLSHLSQLI